MENSKRQQELESQALIKSEWLYKGKIFSLRQDTLQFPENPSFLWDIIIHPGAVAVLPITKNGTLLLIHQWRRPINQIIYELPAGTLEERETPLKCAERELQEEVGYKANQFIPLGGLYSAPGFCTEYIHLFIAKNLEKSELPKDIHEAIDLVEISLESALNLIDNEEIKDSKTICGILRYKRWLKKH